MYCQFKIIANFLCLLMIAVCDRFNDLKGEVSKVVRTKKKAIQGRKDMLHKHYLQTDYALAFADFTLNSGDDHALVVSKKLFDRQFRRLRKLDPSTGLSDNSRDMKIDLYFQHYSGQHLHSSMESVLKQLMDDVKVLDAPPPPPAAPKPAPTPPAAAAITTPPPPPLASPPASASSVTGGGGGIMSALLSSPMRGTAHQPAIRGMPTSAAVRRGCPPTARGGAAGFSPGT